MDKPNGYVCREECEAGFTGDECDIGLNGEIN